VSRRSLTRSWNQGASEKKRDRLVCQHSPHTAGDVGQTFVVQDDQDLSSSSGNGELAPILKEITKDLGVGRHDGSGTDDGKLHEVLTLSPKGWDRAEEYHTDVQKWQIQQPSLILSWRLRVDCTISG